VQPMVMYDFYHDQTQKKIISLQQLNPLVATPTLVPAGLTGNADIKILLDTLFNHPNTGPFICKQLIQKLVTSNPSPGYIYRVSQVFANNGNNVRGDLGAVVKAILTDYEARSLDVINNSGYGKIKEPIIRFVSVLRALKTAAPNGRFMDSYWGNPQVLGQAASPKGIFVWGSTDLGEKALKAPSVFNFFSPTYSPAGEIAKAGLLAPEMQITDSHLAVTEPNLISELIYKSPPTDPLAPTPSPYLVNDFSSYTSLAQNTDSLISEMDLLFCQGNMSQSTKSIIKQSISQTTAPDILNNYQGSKPTYFVGSNPLMAPSPALFDTNNITLEMWYYPTSITNFSWIAGKLGHFTGPPYCSYAMYIDSYGHVGFEIGDTSTNKDYMAYSSSTVSVKKWVHIAATYDGKLIKLYLNGVLESQTAYSGTPIIDPTSNFLVIGTNSYMSQTRYWNIARTQKQIQQSMNEGVPSDKTGLVGSWILDDGQGTSGTDTSGNKLDLIPEWSGNNIYWISPDIYKLTQIQLAMHMTVASPDSALQK